MIARPYQFYKYIYTDDFNTDTLKAQRVYLNKEDLQPIITITSKFQERLVSIPDRVETNFNGELQRHLLTYANAETGVIASLKQFIPFNTQDDIKIQISEILAKNNVICGDYKGENSGIQGKINNG